MTPSNLSQARLGSQEKDLDMEGTDFNLATSILFVGYLLMQLPSNLILTLIPPARFLGAAMCIWQRPPYSLLVSTSFMAGKGYNIGCPSRH